MRAMSMRSTEGVVLLVLWACGEGAGPTDGGGGAASASSTSSGGATGGGASGSGGGAVVGWDLARPDPGEWPMFKRDLAHAGFAGDMQGAIDAQSSCVKWERPVTGVGTRGAGGAVIAQVAGQWLVLVAVDGSCDDSGAACTNEAPGTLYALDGATGAIAFRAPLPNDSRADPYAPLVADVDADGRREIVVPASFQANANYLYSFSTEDEGQGPGALEWTFTYAAGASSETAPVAANFDPSDDALEILFGNDTGASGDPASYFAVSGLDGALLSQVPIPGRFDQDPDCEDLNKIDSSSPAAFEVGGELRAFVGSWNGRFYSFRWTGSDLAIAWEYLIPPSDTLACTIGKVRGGPAVADLDGDGAPEVIVGTMYEDDLDATSGYAPEKAIFQAATLRMLDAATGAQKGHVDGVGDWKSTPSLADLDPAEPGLEIAGGRVGGVYSLRSNGGSSWNVDLSGGFVGNRSSPALADIDGDGELEVVIAVEASDDASDAGLFVLDGATGAVEWSSQAAPLVSGQGYRGGSSSPAIGDIDGDGSLEIVYLGADGVLRAIDSACD